MLLAWARGRTVGACRMKVRAREVPASPSEAGGRGCPCPDAGMPMAP